MRQLRSFLLASGLIRLSRQILKRRLSPSNRQGAGLETRRFRIEDERFPVGADEIGSGSALPLGGTALRS